MRILFMGTPELARECLRAVYEKAGGDVVAVVTRPDQPKGRGMKMTPSPVKEFAVENGIPVYQPKTLRNGAFSEELKAIDPELILVAAYGNILPHEVIAYPKYGCVNAHGSLLPKYRGAAPIERAIMDGETRTGITAMMMDDGLDTGDIIRLYPCDIEADDDGGSLTEKLARLAGIAMCDTIDAIEAGTLTCTKQPAESNYAAKIEKEDTLVDFSRSPAETVNQIRALSPEPYAVTRTADGHQLKLTKACVLEGSTDAEPGTVVRLAAKGEGLIVLSCGGGLIGVSGVVPEGKKKMTAGDYIRGRKIAEGDCLGMPAPADGN